jgi:hypothetical protein
VSGSGVKVLMRGDGLIAPMVMNAPEGAMDHAGHHRQKEDERRYDGGQPYWPISVGAHSNKK